MKHLLTIAVALLIAACTATDELIERGRDSRFEWLGDNMRLETGVADVDQHLRTAFTFTAAGRTISVLALTLHPDDGGNARDFTPFPDGQDACFPEAAPE